MLRKVLFAVFGLFITMSAHAGQAINVEWVHKFVKQEHGLDIPYADNPKLVVNMEYVLKVVDMANAYFNGDGWTNYGESEYATREVADTVAGIYCIRNLIERYYFTATTTPDTTSFSFQISAAGAYHVDWGDGTREHYYKAYTDTKSVSHTYQSAGSYNIKIGGYSSAYHTNKQMGNPVINFANNKKLAGISGNIGKIFPTLKGKNNQPMQPTFAQTFYNCTNLNSEIPEELFVGVHGAARAHMFQGVFMNCSNLESKIPERLFAGINGLAEGVFNSTFKNCSKIYGTIPKKLFAKIKGQLVNYDFIECFMGCSGLTGAIPEDLFANISGPIVGAAFKGLFSGCTKLGTEISEIDTPQYIKDGYAIPPKLFANIGGAPKSEMFAFTFSNCSGLKGIIPSGVFGNYENKDAAPGMFNQTFSGCTNITHIEAGLFGTISGVPAKQMFYQTFYNCVRLTEIPPTLFATIGGQPAEAMFQQTFCNCDTLKKIPNGLFSAISGTPAPYMFSLTFDSCDNLTGAIPDDLIGRIYGAPAQQMFAGMFRYCPKLGIIESDADKPQYMRDGYAIPPNLFGGENGLKNDAAPYMFSETFNGCAGLTGRIPEFLFGKLNGLPANGMFKQTFRLCSGLTGEIPVTLFNLITGTPKVQMFLETFYYCSGLTSFGGALFAGISGKPAQSMFAQTFYACSGLSGAIPDGLFGDISGAPAAGMFSQTFYGCAKLGTGITDADKPEYMLRGYAIPETLFGRITENSNAAGSMFASTFFGCVGLSGQIPPLLFGGINGLTNGTASWMFSHTFYNCSGLTGEIPFGLFGDMTGAPQERMFEATFQGCSGLTKIPEYLFGHISGPGALCAYRWVFAGCRNLEGAIPDYLFAGVYGAGAYTFSRAFRDCAKLTSIPEHLFGAVTEFSFDETFYGCVELTGPSAKVYVESEGAYKYLYEVWPDVNYGFVYYMDTKLEDYGAWE